MEILMRVEIAHKYFYYVFFLQLLKTLVRFLLYLDII